MQFARPLPADIAAALRAPERLAAAAGFVQRGGAGGPAGARASTPADALAGVLEDVAHLIGQPVVVASVVLDDAQLVLAAHGLTGWYAEAGGVPARWAPCAYVVAAGAPLAVVDARRDLRTAGSRLVTHGGVGTYVGAPLRTARGAVVGALCAVGPAPTEHTPEQLAVLQRMADEVAWMLDPGSMSAGRGLRRIRGG